MKIPLMLLICIYGNVLHFVFSSSVPRVDYGELKVFRGPVTYNVDTTVLLNDVSRKDKEIGYKIKASLDLEPVWSHGDSEFLLKFHLKSPRLHARGTHITADFVPYKAIWDSYSYSTFYAHWKNGLFVESYLDASEPIDIINYKKSLISLFQFQVIDGEHNETDVSGTCSVLYETLSMQVIRKIKKNCWFADEEVAVAESRRLTRYSLNSELDALNEVYAEELHVAGDSPAGVALKARAWQRLTRVDATTPTSVTPLAATLSAALAELPVSLTPHTLELIPTNDSFDDDLELSAELAAAAAALRTESAGSGGDAAAALAALTVPPAMLRTPRSALEKLLDEEQDPELLAGLLRMLGLAGGAATHGAAAAFLQLHRREPLADSLAALAHNYLAALALADRPQESVVLDVLKVGEGGGPLAEPALLAAAAAAPRAAPSAPRAERAVRDALVKGLVKCKDEECEVVRLQALGNLRRADCAQLLLSHAERARTAPVALAALGALAALDLTELAEPDVLRRLEALALAPRRPALAALDVRAAALDLLLALSASAPMHLYYTAHALHDSESELRRVFWQRLRELSADHEHVRTLLRVLPPRLTSWHARASPGTSSALSREVGAWRGRRARLASLQLAQRALLRRGRVSLLLFDHSNSTQEAFAVEVWTRGLEAIAGGSGGSEDESAEETAGGLALAVGGARLPGVTLFNGQGELLGHVWAGRGSEPTPVLRALWPLRPDVPAGRVPLQVGATLRWRFRAAVSLALDAQAQVSLWSRSARSQLELRAALAAQCDARVGAGDATLTGRARLTAEPRLRIAADLDFYSDVALCVRVSLPAHERHLNTTLNSSVGAHRVRRERLARHPAPARTLALGAPNDVTCRTLTSADD